MIDGRNATAEKMILQEEKIKKNIDLYNKQKSKTADKPQKVYKKLYLKAIEKPESKLSHEVIEIKPSSVKKKNTVFNYFTKKVEYQPPENDSLEIIDDAVERDYSELSKDYFSNYPIEKIEKEVFERVKEYSIKSPNFINTERGSFKFLGFFDVYRPPFFAIFTKTSSVVNGENPLGKDENINYDIDSDSEWGDEDEEGEVLSCKCRCDFL